MDKKPSVLPTAEQMAAANETGDMISNQLQEENKVQTQFGTDLESDAAYEMKRRTDDQLKMREENIGKFEEIARQMDEKRARQAKEKHPYAQEESYKSETQPQQTQIPQQPPVPPQVPPQGPTDNGNHDYYGGSHFNNTPAPVNSYIDNLSQPQMNQPFDIIPLPSEGKFYPGIKKTVKVAFLTTADENILTSPNLVESGDFLEILINRKLLEPNLRYKDLLPGDRNAIMIWLRATGYGEKYPVTMFDSNNEPFETEINLSELKTISLNIQPDSKGLYSFTLPTSSNEVKFRLLTVGDLDRLEEIIELNKDSVINEEQTMILENQIVEVNGNSDRAFIQNFSTTMRILDAQKLREYMGSISCGIDMNIEVRSPGGETIKTFLPLTPKFFWPNSEL